MTSKFLYAQMLGVKCIKTTYDCERDYLKTSEVPHIYLMKLSSSSIRRGIIIELAVIYEGSGLKWEMVFIV